MVDYVVCINLLVLVQYIGAPVVYNVLLHLLLSSCMRCFVSYSKNDYTNKNKKIKNKKNCNTEQGHLELRNK
jgi:hypothetical protein